MHTTAPNVRFGQSFKNLRLQAGIATQHDLGRMLAERGFAFEDSFFSHLQAGRKIPKKRPLFLCLLQVFKQHNPALTLEACNEFLGYAGQGYLTEQEQQIVGFGVLADARVAQGKAALLKPSWYQRMAEDYIIIFRKYITDDTYFYQKLQESYEIVLDLLWQCIHYGFAQEVLGLWEIVKKYQWEKAHWQEYANLAAQIHALLAAKNFRQEALRVQVDDVAGMYLYKKQFLPAYKLLNEVRAAVESCDDATKGAYYHKRGVVYFCYGRYQKSLAAFTTSLFRYEQAGAIQEACRAALDAGIAYEKLGDLGAAEDYYHRYLVVAEKHNFLEFASSLEFHLSEIYAAQHNPAKERQYLQRSLAKEVLLNSKAGEGWRERFVKTKIQVCVDSYLK